MINRTMGRIPAVIAATALSAAAALLPSCAASASSAVPRFGHVVIVVMENKNYNAIIGRPSEAPYLNKLASGGAVFSNSYAITHPSQPNYLALFSGSTQGVTNDNCPQNFGNVPNLGAELISSGLKFAGYSESMPSAGYTGCGSYFSLGYIRTHNPWADFRNVPAASNLTFASFPGNYSRLPAVSFAIPNLCHDMHYCPRDTGDSWIQHHLGGYATWAQSHNSLLIITWDEDGTVLGTGGDNNRVATIFYGAHVRPGTYTERISHYSILRTVEDMYGLAHAGASASAAPITNVWK
ncbi:MAG TPA: alkaline phosphatase family protein [Streptosporangiaceae bacterium]|jgi:acid phosphatase|nr:alkaline phosphatase family protein [Streptosporangiaceae bacterium]